MKFMVCEMNMHSGKYTVFIVVSATEQTSKELGMAWECLFSIGRAFSLVFKSWTFHSGLAYEDYSDIFNI